MQFACIGLNAPQFRLQERQIVLKFIYKNETYTLTPFVKPYPILNLAK